MKGQGVSVLTNWWTAVSFDRPPASPTSPQMANPVFPSEPWVWGGKDGWPASRYGGKTSPAPADPWVWYTTGPLTGRVGALGAVGMAVGVILNPNVQNLVGAINPMGSPMGGGGGPDGAPLAY